MKFYRWTNMKTALLFLMICCQRNKKSILICFLLEVGIIILIYTLYLKALSFSEKTQFVINLIFLLFKQTQRDITLVFLDIAGLDMNLKGWEQLCRKAWENEYDYSQIDRFAKTGEGRYTITECNKNIYIECTLETKLF